MTMLTIRQLPLTIRGNVEDTRYRLDTALVKMVQAQVQQKNDKVRVSKRFAIELALIEWLEREGVVAEKLNIPELGMVA